VFLLLDISDFVVMHDLLVGLFSNTFWGIYSIQYVPEGFSSVEYPLTRLWKYPVSPKHPFRCNASCGWLQLMIAVGVVCVGTPTPGSHVTV
jgi:hypothetical protein